MRTQTYVDNTVNDLRYEIIIISNLPKWAQESAWMST